MNSNLYSNSAGRMHTRSGYPLAVDASRATYGLDDAAIDELQRQVDDYTRTLSPGYFSSNYPVQPTGTGCGTTIDSTLLYSSSEIQYPADSALWSMPASTQSPDLHHIQTFQRYATPYPSVEIAPVAIRSSARPSPIVPPTHRLHDGAECLLCIPNTRFPIVRTQSAIDAHLALHNITDNWLDPALPVDSTRRCPWPKCNAKLLEADVLVRSHIARHHFGLEKYAFPFDELHEKWKSSCEQWARTSQGQGHAETGTEVRKTKPKKRSRAGNVNN